MKIHLRYVNLFHGKVSVENAEYLSCSVILYKDKTEHS